MVVREKTGVLLLDVTRRREMQRLAIFCVMRTYVQGTKHCGRVKAFVSSVFGVVALCQKTKCNDIRIKGPVR